MPNIDDPNFKIPSMTEATPLLAEKMEVPSSSSTSLRETTKGKKPQAIAHRGYKAAHPENTMGAFRGAVEVGAHAIETDIHISKDGVVVLSHVRPPLVWVWQTFMKD